MTKPLLLLALLLTGCATEERWLTKEQDAALKEKCEPHGCVAVPIPLFEQIVKALKGMKSA